MIKYPQHYVKQLTIHYWFCKLCNCFLEQFEIYKDKDGEFHIIEIIKVKPFYRED